jgi:hypothetical protein
VILAVSRNPLISTTQHVWVVLGRSWDQAGTKLGPSRSDVTGVVAVEVRRACEATSDAVKQNETKPLPSLRIGGNQ